MGGHSARVTTADEGSLTGPWHRILAITAGAEAGSPEAGYVAVLPAVLSAAAQGRPFVLGWISPGGGSPLELITNTAGPAAPDGRGPGEVMFPAGARSVLIGEQWQAALGDLVWTCCPGRSAPPLRDGARDEPDGHRRLAAASLPPTLFESALVNLMSRRFAWLVVAEPTDLLDAELAELRTELNVLQRYDEERSRFDLTRAQRRLAELDAFREAGLWNVRVLAGAATAADLRLLTPVLTGSVDLSRHPYRLRGGLDCSSLAEALTVKAADGDGGATVPFPATAGTLAALAGLPRREVPGLRVLDPGWFDVTSETGTPGPDGTDPGSAGPAAIGLGTILDAQDRPAGPLLVPLATLNRHTFVTGATGAGKSQTVRHILEQCTRAGLPWLAIEPAKSEYAAMAGRVEGAGQVTVINPADPHAVPLSVNPLAPEPGYPVQPHIDMVRALFQAAFAADEPFPQIMSQALQQVYEEAGWDVVTGGPPPGAVAAPAVPTLAQLQRTALAVIDDVGYGSELQADVRGFVDVRLRSLRTGSAGRFFEGGHPVDMAELLRRNVVLAIEDVANDEDKAFLMGTLVIRLVEYLRLRSRRERPCGLRHLIVIEEAHRLLRNQPGERAGTHAAELFAGLLAEIRAYGEGLVVAEQIPAKLLPDVIKNTALKIVHRLPAYDDRQATGAAMNLDEDQSRQVVALPPGVAAVFADGMDRPLRIRVPWGEQRERPLASPPPPVRGRRSAACTPRCAAGRACTLAELRGADLAATAPVNAWLRIWAETLVLAFLTNRSLPAVPGELRQRWAVTAPRLRECALVTVVDAAIGARGASLRASFEPHQLAASVTAAALRTLDAAAGTSPGAATGSGLAGSGLAGSGLSGAGLSGTRAGPNWVIPQLRWLHEAERICPFAGPVSDAYDQAPPLDFDLVGVADWPGMRAGHRIRALRRHPLSPELEANRLIAWNLLLGADDHRGFLADLAVVMVGQDPGTWVSRAAALMDVSGWLSVVLSWPRRFVAAPAAVPAPAVTFPAESGREGLLAR